MTIKLITLAALLVLGSVPGRADDSIPRQLAEFRERILLKRVLYALNFQKLALADCSRRTRNPEASRLVFEIDSLGTWDEAPAPACFAPPTTNQDPLAQLRKF